MFNPDKQKILDHINSKMPVLCALGREQVKELVELIVGPLPIPVSLKKIRAGEIWTTPSRQHVRVARMDGERFAFFDLEHNYPACRSDISYEDLVKINGFRYLAANVGEYIQMVREGKA